MVQSLIMSAVSISVDRIIKAVGECTDDVLDCEVFRTLFAHQDIEAKENPIIDGLRAKLALVACTDCTRIYIPEGEN